MSLQNANADGGGGDRSFIIHIYVLNFENNTVSDVDGIRIIIIITQFVNTHVPT